MMIGGGGGGYINFLFKAANTCREHLCFSRCNNNEKKNCIWNI